MELFVFTEEKETMFCKGNIVALVPRGAIELIECILIAEHSYAAWLISNGALKDYDKWGILEQVFLDLLSNVIWMLLS